MLRVGTLLGPRSTEGKRRWRVRLGVGRAEVCIVWPSKRLPVVRVWLYQTLPHPYSREKGGGERGLRMTSTPRIATLEWVVATDRRPTRKVEVVCGVRCPRAHADANLITECSFDTVSSSV